MTYCLTVWGGASFDAINTLEIMQKRAIRNIANLRRRDHTHDTFTSLHILKMPDIIKLINATYTYKVLNRLIDGPNYFTYPSNNPYHTRTRSNLTIPLLQSSQSQTHIQFRGVKDYNALPPDLKSKPSLPSFKKAVKQHLFSTYTNQ